MKCGTPPGGIIVKKKSKIWLWLAICRDSKKIIAYQLGNRGAKTGRKLWKKIKNIPCKHYCTDYWEAYQQFIPASKHLISKAETYTIESYNGLFRHYLARFHRKTKCYSKKEQMVEYSVLLLIIHLNQKNKNNYL
jgi:insertion element IS1 protein InsB